MVTQITYCLVKRREVFIALGCCAFFKNLAYFELQVWILDQDIQWTMNCSVLCSYDKYVSVLISRLHETASRLSALGSQVILIFYRVLARTFFDASFFSIIPKFPIYNLVSVHMIKLVRSQIWGLGSSCVIRLTVIACKRSKETYAAYSGVSNTVSSSKPAIILLRIQKWPKSYLLSRFENCMRCAFVTNLSSINYIIFLVKTLKCPLIQVYISRLGNVWRNESFNLGAL